MLPDSLIMSPILRRLNKFALVTYKGSSFCFFWLVVFVSPLVVVVYHLSLFKYLVHLFVVMLLSSIQKVLQEDKNNLTKISIFSVGTSTRLSSAKIWDIRQNQVTRLSWRTIPIDVVVVQWNLIPQAEKNEIRIPWWKQGNDPIGCSKILFVNSSERHCQAPIKINWIYCLITVLNWLD